MAVIYVATVGWSKQLSLFGGSPSSSADKRILANIVPSWASDASNKLKFARDLLGADDEVVHELAHSKRFWSVSLEKTLLPRHAFLVTHGLPHGPVLLHSSNEPLDHLLLRPKSDAQFADAVCAASRGQSQSTIAAEYAAFARRFSKGALEAARRGDVDMLRLLYSHGWDASCDRDRNGASALHYAAGHGQVECCAFLVDAAGLDVDDNATDGATPLHWAVAGVRTRGASVSSGGVHADASAERAGFGTGGHLSTASWLARRGASLRATTVAGNSIVHWCAWAGRRALLEWLSTEMGDAMAECVHALNERGCSAAHWAASGGDLSTCQCLAEAHGVDFARRNREGNTPLTKAIEHGREDVVRWLLTSGRCEEAVGEAAGYAARLAARPSADDATHRISECLQSYLLAHYYLRHGQPVAPFVAPSHAGRARPLRMRLEDAEESDSPPRSPAALTVCTGNRCYRSGGARLLAACRAMSPVGPALVRPVGCSGVCPPGLVSVNEGPESEGRPMALEAADDASARASALRVLGVE